MNKIKEVGGFFVALVCVVTQTQAQAGGLLTSQADSFQTASGTFWSMQHTNSPPLPFNMFDLPVISIGDSFIRPALPFPAMASLAFTMETITQPTGRMRVFPMPMSGNCT